MPHLLALGNIMSQHYLFQFIDILAHNVFVGAFWLVLQTIYVNTILFIDHGNSLHYHNLCAYSAQWSDTHLKLHTI